MESHSAVSINLVTELQSQMKVCKTLGQFLHFMAGNPNFPNLRPIIGRFIPRTAVGLVLELYIAFFTRVILLGVQLPKTF